MLRKVQSDIWFNECCKRMKERDAYKKQRDELINDMAETKRKAEAFDEIDDLIVNGTKDREPDAIFQNICHVIINVKESDNDEHPKLNHVHSVVVCRVYDIASIHY